MIGTTEFKDDDIYIDIDDDSIYKDFNLNLKDYLNYLHKNNLHMQNSMYNDVIINIFFYYFFFCTI